MLYAEMAGDAGALRCSDRVTGLSATLCTEILGDPEGSDRSIRGSETLYTEIRLYNAT